MPRKNIDAKDYRKVGIPYTHPYNTRSKDRTSAIRNESDISNTSTSSDSDSSSRILKRIFCETSSEKMNFLVLHKKTSMKAIEDLLV